MHFVLRENLLVRDKFYCLEYDKLTITFKIGGIPIDFTKSTSESFTCSFSYIHLKGL